MDFQTRLDLGDESSMTNWWPRVKDLDIPQPKSIMVKLPSQEEQIELLDGRQFSPEFYKSLQDAVSHFGYPVFVRGDGTSGKHGWKDTCYIKDENESLKRHVYGITEYTFMVSMAGELKNTALYVREFIPLEYAGFNAFFDDFPVAKEVRCFIKNGKKQCQHPLWFADVF